MPLQFNRTKNIFVVLWRATCVWLLAAFAITFSAKAERLPVKIYTSADGLGSSFVNDVMRDSHGFLWFATRDGVSRFDGSRFIAYQVAGKGSPPGIEQIVETLRGDYWIATTGGIYRFDPKKNNENHTPNLDRPSLSAKLVSEQRGVLLEDFSGNLWLANSAFYRIIEREAGKYSLEEQRLDLPPNPSVTFGTNALAASRDGCLWAATNWGLLRLLPDGRKVLYKMENIPENVATDIIEDSAGRIWIARIADFYVLKPEKIDELQNAEALTVRRLEDATEQTTKGATVLPDKSGEIFRFADFKGYQGANTAKYLYETSDKHIWISAGGGVIECDGQRFKPYTNDQGLFKTSRQMVEDAAGNIWFGSAGGVLRLDRDGLTSYGENDGLPQSGILSGESRKGTLYASSPTFQVGYSDGDGFKSIRPDLPPGVYINWMTRPIFQDSAGEWWFLTSEGLYRFAATDDVAALDGQKPLAVYAKKDGFKTDAMFQIFEDSHKNLWLSTRDRNVRSLNNLAYWTRATEEFKFFTEAEGFPPDKAVSAFAEDVQGNIWIGFYEGGLMRFAGGRFRDFTTPETDGLITALHVDRENRLWIATSLNGILRVENPAADEIISKSWTTDNGLTSNNVRSLAEDEFGRIYAGTARGVDRIAPDSGQITHYTVSDGLAGDFVSVALRARDGALWFGTPNGLSRFAPRRQSEKLPPPVRISGLRLGGESLRLPELGTGEISGLELQSDQNNLQIDFFGMDFNPNGSLLYQYKLEGADKDWSQPTLQRSVNLNLAPGSYRFLVRAVNSEGVASAQPANVSFTILPPFWRRWQFIAALVLFIIAAIFALDRYRVSKTRQVEAALAALRRSREERLVELERVRARIATDLHDDIGSSLSQIAVLSEVAHSRTDSAQTVIAEPLQQISEVSNELVEAMSDIVWAINPRKDNLRDLIQRMRRFAADVFTAKNIAFEFDAPGFHENVQLGANIRREIFVIFKESVNNIARHSGATSAALKLEIADDALRLEIKDNGRGFETEKILGADFSPAKGGNGLLNMRERARELEGKCLIASSPENGTEITLEIPLHAQSTENGSVTQTGSEFSNGKK